MSKVKKHFITLDFDDLYNQLETVCLEIKKLGDTESDEKYKLLLKKEMLYQFMTTIEKKEVGESLSDRVFNYGIYTFFNSIDESKIIPYSSNFTEMLTEMMAKKLDLMAEIKTKSYVDGLKKEGKQICNINVFSLNLIHSFLSDINYEPYMRHVKYYGICRPLTVKENVYAPLKSWIGMNLYDERNPSMPHNNDSPDRYLSIYLTYKSIVHNRNVTGLKCKDGVYSATLERGLGPCYKYVLSEDEMVLPSSYKIMKLSGNTKYKLYAALFID